MKLHFLAFAIAAFPCANALAEQGRVVGITDGDTLTVLIDQRPIKIRIAQIDAPESGQPFGKAAKQTLSDLCFNKAATIALGNLDIYKRTVSDVVCGGVDVGSHMVSSGHAWAFDRYVKNKNLFVYQQSAKQMQLGLWQDANPIPPWIWRKQSKGITQ
jgi:micrococcal nuclease